jgi:EpsI family protein
LLGLNFVLKKVTSYKLQVTSEKPSANYELRTTNYQIIGLVIALLLGGIFINWFEQRGEIQVERKSLGEIPTKLGDWTQMGSDIRFSEQTESVLRTSDYVMREYKNSAGKFANLYVGYYASQRTGATYHSPQNCLPGAGWEMKQPELIEITTPNGKTFTANRYIIENGESKAVMIYWYQGRGRTVSSEYTDKIYTVLDSVLRRRSDGAMVRVMTSVNGSEALQTAVDLSARTAGTLSQFVPE